MWYEVFLMQILSLDSVSPHRGNNYTYAITITNNIGLSLIYALLLKYWKNLSYPISSYLNSHNLYNTCQSAYRPGHSTALLKVVNDLFLSLNKGNIMYSLA